MIEILKKRIHPSWYNSILPFFESEDGKKILSFLKEESLKGKVIYPIQENCFKAFLLTPFNEIKIVILGQDCYPGVVHDKPEACGLAFSYEPQNNLDSHVPKSLKNILKEVEDDVYDGLNMHALKKDYEETDLTRWATQGVLLLNTALTVEKGKPGSHLEIWKPFTLHVFKELLNKQTGIIYMLWGNEAKAYKKYINEALNDVLEASHPAAECYKANAGFFGCKHFSKANEILKKNNGVEFEIQW